MLRCEPENGRGPAARAYHWINLAAIWFAAAAALALSAIVAATIHL
jgi:hypothetical protein